MEFLGVSQEITAGIGDIIGADTVSNLDEPKFCITLDSQSGWKSAIMVKNEITQVTSTILIDYNFLPIRCRSCLETTHCARDCPNRSRAKCYRQAPTSQQQRASSLAPVPDLANMLTVSKNKLEEKTKNQDAKDKAIAELQSSSQQSSQNRIINEDRFQVVTSHHRRNNK